MSGKALTNGWLTRLLVVFSLCLGLQNSWALSGTVVAWGSNLWGQTNVPPGLTNIHAVAAGTRHSLAVTSDGRVVAWGDNLSGQGNVPVWLNNVVDVSAGASHSVALRADGTVVAWGANDAGQTNVPVGLANVARIASGNSFNLALLWNGTVIRWGNTSDTRLNVPGGLSAIAIAGGANHAVAVDNLGQVWSWGESTYSKTTPPAYLYNYSRSSSAVAAGENHSVALTAGDVYGWGNNYYSQAAAVIGWSITAISAGANHNLALRNNGTVLAWGDYTDKQTTIPAWLTNVARIAAGGNHSLAIYQNPVQWITQPVSQVVTAGVTVTFSSLATGSAPLTYQWQFNSTNLLNETNATLVLPNVAASATGTYSVTVVNPLGSLPSGSASLVVLVAPAITASPTNQSVPLGAQAEFRVSATGTAALHYQWRKNGVPIPGATTPNFVVLYAQTSDEGAYSVVVTNAAGTATSAAATLTVLLPPVILAHPRSQSVTVGSSVSLGATVSGGQTFQWRKNNSAILGATNVAYLINAVQLTDAGNYSVVISNGGGSVTSSNAVLTVVEAGTSFSLVGWGRQADLWTGSTYADATPPGGLSNLVGIAVGGYHTIALRREGTVVGWGDNQHGQASTPVTNLQQIAAGQLHSLGLKKDGTTAAWGDNTLGQLNIPNTATGVVAVAAGGYFNLALRRDGLVVGWGANGYGQATPLANVSNIQAIAAGYEHSLVLRSNGTVVAWGLNDYGQSRVPTGLSNVVRIAAGRYHSLALLGNGRVMAWGRNDQGQATVPSDPPRVMAIAAGETHSLALLANNQVVCWGGTDGQSETPTGLTGVAYLAGGPTRSLALRVHQTRILSVQRTANNTLQWTIAALDGSAITQDRLPQMLVQKTSGFTAGEANWQMIYPGVTLAGGRLSVTYSNAEPAAVYRVIEWP